MPTPEQIQEAIENTNNQQSFIQNLLIDKLGWNIPEAIIDVEDMSYIWTDDELGAEDLDRDITAGQIYQIQKMRDDQPWGIFVLEFTNENALITGRGLTGPLRKVLRGLVPKRRSRPANLESWEREELLFVCTYKYKYFRFAYFKSPKEKGHAEPLITFDCGLDIPSRTAYENLCYLDWPDEETTPEQWVSKWSEAFDVEKVTKKFYDDYERVFTNLQNQLALSEDEDKKMFAQLLMNRLMFLRFVEIKGWLRFRDTQQGPQNYLKELFQAGPVRNSSWYNSRLKVLFFEGMAIPNHQREEIIGQVPYLNGGLFEKTPLDEQVTDIPYEAFEQILGEHGLFYRYNFTIEESTPLDIDVAVDPETLGKVFEKLVIERREKGSYYTPRTVVSFMCREALKGYLSSEYASLVDENSTVGITINEAKDLLRRLDIVKVVDPACGSGAYLLGMLHELYSLTSLLDTRAETQSPRNAYRRKLSIIQNNLYGVDIDDFAINIARLRLWLSLAVEYEGDIPEPLPNLDFKIETGDSLTAPDPSGDIDPGLHRELMRRYVGLRGEYLTAATGKEKRLKLEEIQQLKQNVTDWVHAGGPVSGFDWQVEFLEVFLEGGFDIVIANPPYGGKGEAKVPQEVRDAYFNQRIDAERGQARDPYGIFIARGLQLLQAGGILSYVVSDTWRTIKTHGPLRKRLLETTTVLHVLDLPSWIFDATVNTGIVTLKKVQPEDAHTLIAGDLRAILNGDWKLLSDNLLAVSGHGPDIQTIECARYTYPQSLIASYDNLSFFICSPSLYCLMSAQTFEKLHNFADIKVGLQTGENRYYVRKRPCARGNYLIINEAEVLTDEEIANLSSHQKLNGVNPDEYGCRHFVRYDKGESSNITEGWLPNYYVPSDYFIDWSETAVHRLRTDPRARFQNSQYYFVQGLSWSDAGFYSPTIRLSGNGVFDVKGSRMVIEEGGNLNVMSLSGILCSKLLKLLIKAISNHTVSTQVDDFREMPIVTTNPEALQQIELLVAEILERQRIDQQYSYHLNEQREIDTLVYSLYGLGDEDIREVELWHCRRYALLAEAQGFLAEVKEKYADHLARCQLILEKPPSYWRSNPVLELISQGESHELEFKETLEYNIHTNQRTPELAKSSLKTIAAFLNADGGVLLLGVSDSGEVKGLDRDLQFVNRHNLDGFEQKLRSLLNSRFDPSPLGNVEITFEELQEGTVCQIKIEQSSEPVAFDNDFYIRDGNGTRKLEGRALTDWLRRRNNN